MTESETLDEIERLTSDKYYIEAYDLAVKSLQTFNSQKFEKISEELQSKIDGIIQRTIPSVNMRPYIMNRDENLWNKARTSIQEVFLLTRINGQITVKELQRISGMTPWNTLKSLCRLAMWDIISFKNSNQKNRDHSFSHYEQSRKRKSSSNSSNSSSDYKLKFFSSPEELQNGPYNSKSSDSNSSIDTMSIQKRIKHISLGQRDFDFTREELQKIYDTYSQQDYYTIFGVPRDIDTKTLREVAARLMKTYHSDMYKTQLTRDIQTLLDDIFQIVHTGFRILSDPLKRSRYDNTLAKTEKSLKHDEIFFKESPKVSRVSPVKDKKKDKKKKKGSRIADSKIKNFATPNSKIKNTQKKADTLHQDSQQQSASNSTSDSTITASPRKREAKALYDEALSLFENRKLKEAEETVIKAIKKNAKEQNFYYLLSRIQLDRNRNLEEAKLNAKRAISLDRENPEYHLHLGKIYRILGNETKAERQAKMALAWDSDYRDANELLKSIREEKNKSFLKKFLKKKKK